MGKKILVVDDENDVLKVVTFRLEKKGYEVQTAIDGQKALDMLQKEKPDLILLDLRLPVIDGYEVCKMIKKDENFKNVPIILITATSAGEINERIQELDADDYIVKPFDPEELTQKVEKLIG